MYSVMLTKAYIINISTEIFAGRYTNMHTATASALATIYHRTACHRLYGRARNIERVLFGCIIHTNPHRPGYTRIILLANYHYISMYKQVFLYVRSYIEVKALRAKHNYRMICAKVTRAVRLNLYIYVGCSTQ